MGHLKFEIKPDTLVALSTTPIHLGSLFPNIVIQKVEEEITNYDNKHYSSSPHMERGGITPTLSLQRLTKTLAVNQGHQPGKQSASDQKKRGLGKTPLGYTVIVIYKNSDLRPVRIASHCE